MHLFIDLHIIQSVPPSNINRDDTGSPKSAFYGGVRRARVSSQAWKRAIRTNYQDDLDDSDLGVRTKRAVELLCERMTMLRPELSQEEANRRAAAVLAALGIKVESTASKTKKKAIESGEEGEGFDTTQYLIFWSNRQLDRLAELALTDQKLTKKLATEAADQEHGIDIALFGRMVADAADINVDAAMQVAHAISTHAAEIEQDYFTAVDDKNPEEETGAGMIGTVEFNAATLYRYATVNVHGLRANLGDDKATVRAVEAVVRGFVTSMPTGKQNTFANRTIPEAVLVCVRTDQPVNLVGAFEDAVPSEHGYVRESVNRLTDKATRVAEVLGAPAHYFVASTTAAADSLNSLAQSLPLDRLVAEVAAVTRDQLSADAT